MGRTYILNGEPECYPNDIFYDTEAKLFYIRSGTPKSVIEKVMNKCVVVHFGKNKKVPHNILSANIKLSGYCYSGIQ